MMRWADLAERGMLPVDGGMLDQCAYFEDFVGVAHAAMSIARAEAAE